MNAEILREGRRVSKHSSFRSSDKNSVMHASISRNSYNYEEKNVPHRHHKNVTEITGLFSGTMKSM